MQLVFAQTNVRRPWIYTYILLHLSKSLPDTNTSTLGPDNVNTAFTLACSPNSEMVIFRREEWKKVFIHETFHTYGLDFSSHDSNEHSQGSVSEDFSNRQ